MGDARLSMYIINKIKKYIRNNVAREKLIKEFGVRLHKIHKVELVWSLAKNYRRKATKKKFGMSAWKKKKKGKNSKFLDAENNN